MADVDADSKPPQQQPPTGLSRWTPSMPTNLMSMLNPFAGDDENKPNTEATPKNKSFLSGFLAPNASTADEATSEKDDASVMFAEPDTNSNSDIASREGSIDGRRNSKRSNKPKTCYSICHPAPTSSNRRKLHRRPRSLLQLHELQSEARPLPAYEVIPSANFSVRLLRAINRVFKTKHSLCPNDLLVLKAEKYSGFEPDEEQEARDIVALICKGGRKEDGGATGKAKICFPEGREWEAYPTPNCGYEFFSTDEHGLGLTVRWVPKRNKDGSKMDPSKRKFNFSTISPNSRRHPVIATLSKTQLDVNHTYVMPNPSAATPLSTPRQNSGFLTDAMEDEQDENEQSQTDDRLRTIIVMTGIWVAFKEGWSPHFKYDDKDKDAAAIQRSPSMQQRSPSKSATFASPVSTPPGSPQQMPQLEKRSSVKSVGSSMFRTGSLLRKGNRVSSMSVPDVETEPTEYFESAKKTGRTRADSTSTVLVHRAASNRTRNHQATWRPDLLDAQREMSEPPSDDGRNSASIIAPFDGGSPQRRQSTARPILPPTTSSADGSQDDAPRSKAATPRSVGARPTSGSSSPEKRESSTTTATTSTATSEHPRKPAAVSPKKVKGWRRLLCGSSHSDV